MKATVTIKLEDGGIITIEDAVCGVVQTLTPITFELEGDNVRETAVKSIDCHYTFTIDADDFDMGSSNQKHERHVQIFKSLKEMQDVFDRKIKP